MVNPTKLSWNHNGKNTDGTAIDTARNPHFNIRVNGTPFFSVPLAFKVGTSSYEFPVASAGFAEGTHNVTMTLAVTNPDVESVESNAVQVVISKVPSAPLALSAV